MATTSSSGPRRARARAPGQGSPGSRALVAQHLRRGAHGCRGRCDLRRCLPPCEPRAHQSAQRVSATALGYTGGHDRPWHRQAPPGHLLPGLAPRALSLARKVALTSCSPPARVLGVSRRRLEKLTWALGSTKRSTSQISHDGPQPRCGGEGRSQPSPGQRSLPDRAGRMPWWSRYERPAGPSMSTRSSSLE